MCGQSLFAICGLVQGKPSAVTHAVRIHFRSRSEAHQLLQVFANVRVHNQLVELARSMLHKPSRASDQGCHVQFGINICELAHCRLTLSIHSIAQARESGVNAQCTSQRLHVKLMLLAWCCACPCELIHTLGNAQSRISEAVLINDCLQATPSAKMNARTACS